MHISITGGTGLKLAIGEHAVLLQEGQRALPGKMAAAHYRFAFANLADALRDLLGKWFCG